MIQKCIITLHIYHYNINKEFVSLNPLMYSMNGLQQMVNHTLQIQLQSTSIPKLAQIQKRYKNSKQKQQKYEFPRKRQTQNNTIIQPFNIINSLSASSSQKQLNQGIYSVDSKSFYNLYWQNRMARRQQKFNKRQENKCKPVPKQQKFNYKSGFMTKGRQQMQKYNKTKILDIKRIQQYTLRAQSRKRKQKIRVTTNNTKINTINNTDKKQKCQQQDDGCKTPTNIQNYTEINNYKTPTQIQTPPRKLEYDNEQQLDIKKQYVSLEKKPEINTKSKSNSKSKKKLLVMSAHKLRKIEKLQLQASPRISPKKGIKLFLRQQNYCIQTRILNIF